LWLAGFPVPPGFVVTTAAYQAFVAANHLEEAIAAQVEVGSQISNQEHTLLAANLQAVFEHGAMPPEVKKAILAGYRLLGPGENLPVAVRSSATAEDQARASFAGQASTCLDVCGDEAVLAAVRDVWASLWSSRAAFYRASHDEPGTVPDMAVVIQTMVPAEYSGVLFTCNPLTGEADQVVIEAVQGLGEALVAGQVPPQRLVLDKSSGEIMQLQAGEPGSSSLAPGQVAGLLQLGRALEAHAGASQDVEWAIAGGKIHLLQARPITALAPGQAGRPAVIQAPGDDRWPAVDERPPQPYDLWSQAVLGEVWPHPVSPLMWSGVPTIIGGSIRHSLRGLNSPSIAASQWAGRFFGRVYYNEGALVHLLSDELGLPGSFVNAAVGSRRGVDPGGGAGFRPIRFLRGLPFIIRMARTQLGTGRELEDLFRQIDGWTAGFSEARLAELSDGELWEEFLVWAGRFNHAISLQAEISNAGITAFALLEWLLDRWLGRKELAQSMITGLSGVFAAEMGVALWQVAQAVEKAGLAEVVLGVEPAEIHHLIQEAPGGDGILHEMDGFLTAFGHRCPNEGEWLYPRWAEAPEQLWPLIAAYLRAGGRIDPGKAEARQRERREQAVAQALSGLDPLRRNFFRRVLARAQHGARLRDNGKHYYMKLALPIRRIDLAFGSRWAARGWLERPEDVFFLAIPDIQAVLAAGEPVVAGLDLASLVRDRRAAFKYWSALNYVPALIRSDGRPLEEGRAKDGGNGSQTGEELPGKEPLASDRVLHGIPASGGTARGIARLVSSPGDAMDLGPGDILVTRAADPGWTPVFTLVGGLVLEVGGQLSHAAIVARECGLPAVVNVPAATRQIREGQELFVDGTRGEIHLVGE
jgi:pyruvate,water dikinase